MTVVQQVMIIYAVTNGFLDDVALDKIRDWETGFHTFMAAQYAAIIEEIRTKKALSDELTAKLKDAITAYKKQVPA
jgi:F-type H+-transporting ATPase subunit alpha